MCQEFIRHKWAQKNGKLFFLELNRLNRNTYCRIKKPTMLIKAWQGKAKSCVNKNSSTKHFHGQKNVVFNKTWATQVMVKLFTQEFVSCFRITHHKKLPLSITSVPHQMLQNIMNAEWVTNAHPFIWFCKFCLHIQNQFAKYQSNKTKSSARLFIFQDYDRESKDIHLIFLARAPLISKLFEIHSL